MGIELILFYLFAAIMLGAALLMVCLRNPVHSVMLLILTFVSCAVVWVLLEAEFLGIVLVQIYVGAVLVFFMFVVMMLDFDIAVMRAHFIRHLPLGILVAVVMAAEIVLVIWHGGFGLADKPAPAPTPLSVNNTHDLGMLLFTNYIYQVEIAAVILLVAIVAAIRLVLRKRSDRKHIDPSKQVKVQRNERLKILKIKPELGKQAMPEEPTLVAEEHRT